VEKLVDQGTNLVTEPTETEHTGIASSRENDFSELVPPNDVKENTSTNPVQDCKPESDKKESTPENEVKQFWILVIFLKLFVSFKVEGFFNILSMV